MSNLHTLISSLCSFPLAFVFPIVFLFTMALVNITNVVVLDNPAPFTNQFSFEVTFECLQELHDGKFRHCLSSCSLSESFYHFQTSSGKSSMSVMQKIQKVIKPLKK